MHQDLNTQFRQAFASSNLLRLQMGIVESFQIGILYFFCSLSFIFSCVEVNLLMELAIH